MPFQCCSWILHLFHCIIGGEDFISCLPDDVLIEIFSRLPAQSIVQCRKVCSRWRVLTLTRDFIELHLRKATPAVFIYDFVTRDLTFSIVDEKREEEYGLKGLEALKLDTTHWGCNGLMIFCTHNTSSRYVVLNPLSKGRIIKIDSSDRGMIFGFYFHPLEKEYRILFVRRCQGGTDATCYEYQIFQLEAKKWRSAAVRYFPWTPCFSMNSNNLVNEALHWLVRDDDKSIVRIVGIMAFEIDSENISMKSLPMKEYSTDKFNKVSLLVKEDHLCFCRTIDEEFKLEIWILEDYRSWAWSLRYRVNLDWGLKEYPTYSLPSRLLEYLIVLSIHRNQISLCLVGNGLFSYHLDRHSAKKMSYQDYAGYGCVVPYTESAVVLQG